MQHFSSLPYRSTVAFDPSQQLYTCNSKKNTTEFNKTYNSSGWLLMKTKCCHNTVRHIILQYILLKFIQMRSEFKVNLTMTQKSKLSEIKQNKNRTLSGNTFNEHITHVAFYDINVL